MPLGFVFKLGKRDEGYLSLNNILHEKYVFSEVRYQEIVFDSFRFHSICFRFSHESFDDAIPESYLALPSNRDLLSLILGIDWIYDVSI